MRKAITSKGNFNESPIVIIDNYGTTSQICFGQTLYSNNKIDYKTLLKFHKIRLTDEYATKLLNENLDLFPVQF